MLLAFVDLDDFKQINDVYGHDAGDDFLLAVGQRLKDGSRVHEVLARVGGDEFVVAGIGPGEFDLAQQAANAFKIRLANLLAGEYQLHSTVINYAGPSIGAIAVNPALTDHDLALREADAAMYLEKERRRKPLPDSSKIA